MTDISRRNLIKLGTVAACQIATGGAAQNARVTVTSTEDWLANPADSQIEHKANFAVADLWWPEQRNVWTPVGWKDHYFRFNVLYNGTIICEPCPHFAPPRPHALRWKGQSFQLNFYPLTDEPPPLPKEVTQLWRMDGGVGIQGWNPDHATPVLWTEWRLQTGLVVRQEIFSHVPGGRSVATRIEPHYAWVRLSVVHVDSLSAAKLVKFAIQLSQVYYRHVERYHWEDGITIDVEPKDAPYWKALHAERGSIEGVEGVRLHEPDNKIRIIAFSNPTNKISFSESLSVKNVYSLSVELKGELGEHVDILLPFLPGDEQAINTELTLGFERALSESNNYWSDKPADAAIIHVPEGYINGLIVQSIKLAQVIAERDYENGDYTFLTGSWGYDNLWSTPSSMTTHMFLDLLGYNECVAQHLEIFRKHQGSVKPPGPSYDLHPGYFSTPASLTAFNWLTDHGAILHQVSTHALLSNDHKFISAWTDAIVKGCDFIKDSCARPSPNAVNGLLPPAVATDDLIPTQAVYSLAWNYKGLTTAIKLLKRIQHPRAAEFDALAHSYKTTFVNAFRKLAASAPAWTDSSGKQHCKPPTTLSDTPMPYHSFSAAFYLDGGPMVAVWAGLMDADDELMRASVLYFREGPDTRLYGYRPNPLDRPVLIHEISSCEPCYSWNILHSWQLGDRRLFLEGVYSLLAGSISKQTYSACEHRHGIQSTQCPTYMAFYCMRLAVIDDEIADGELHLLRLCPQAWVTQQETVFENMPTLYGLVSLRFRLSEDKRRLDVQFQPRWHHVTPKVVLHTSAVPGITHAVVNGRRYRRKEEIAL
jgi:hypothetical protein